MIILPSSEGLIRETATLDFDCRLLALVDIGRLLSFRLWSSIFHGTDILQRIKSLQRTDIKFLIIIGGQFASKYSSRWAASISLYCCGGRWTVPENRAMETLSTARRRRPWLRIQRGDGTPTLPSIYRRLAGPRDGVFAPLDLRIFLMRELILVLVFYGAYTAIVSNTDAQVISR
jgi:hypothetical protein